MKVEGRDRQKQGEISEFLGDARADVERELIAVFAEGVHRDADIVQRYAGSEVGLRQQVGGADVCGECRRSVRVNRRVDNVHAGTVPDAVRVRPCGADGQGYVRR